MHEGTSKPNRSLSPSTGRVVVLGYIVRGPIGGMTWHYLNYVVGLAALGWDVLFVEDSDDYPSCYDPTRHVVSAEPDYGLAYAAAVFKRAGLPGRWAYYDAHTAQWHGSQASEIPALLSGADLLISVSGINPVREWMLDIPVRVLIDTDPAFTQIRHLQSPDTHDRAATFTHYFSFGENIGQPSCGIPDDGFPWRPTRQPIALDQWRASPPPAGPPRFTTVMQWDSYDTLKFDGREYGMKSLSFAPYFALPDRAPVVLELALGSPDAPRPELSEAGWAIADPLRISETPWTYQTYIQGSAGEFAVAKHGYVETRSGWFSERSACYLSAGRPVVLQDTGFSSPLPTGHGLFAFNSPEEAIAALEACHADLPRHAKAARELAGDCFDARRVLQDLLDAL